MGSAAAAFRFRALWRAVGHGLVLATAWGSLTPRPPELAFAAGDQVIHAGAYGVMALWFGQLYPGWRREACVVAAFIGLGIALEFAQAYWSIYRHFDWYDAAASAVGAVSAWALLHTRVGYLLQWLDTRLSALV
jgi:VanZ family protein